MCTCWTKTCKYCGFVNKGCVRFGVKCHNFQCNKFIDFEEDMELVRTPIFELGRNKMKTILVTGAAGFCGSQLCGDLLNNRYKVRALDNFYRNNGNSLLEFVENKNFEFQRGDITNLYDCAIATKGVDCIVNLAAIVGEPACRRNPKLAYLVNLDGVKNLIQVNVDKVPILQASTGSVYGAVVGDVCNENTPLNTLSEYGLSKLEAEKLLSKENSISLRFATGSGVSRNLRLDLLVNDLVYKAVKENSITLFQADFLRTFISVKDMSLAFVHCINNYDSIISKGKVFNVGDESLNLSKRQLAQIIQRKTGCSIFEADSGYKDRDARNYKCDFSLFKSTNWKISQNIDLIINDLLSVIPLIMQDTQYFAR